MESIQKVDIRSRIAYRKEDIDNVPREEVMNKGQDPIEFISRCSAGKEGDIEIYKPLGEQMLGCFFDLFWKLLFRPSACGTLTVSAGAQEIFVNTCFTPSEVWLSVGEAEGKPGCGPQDDSFDIRYVPKGFILITKTNSPRRKVKWKAIG